MIFVNFELIHMFLNGQDSVIYQKFEFRGLTMNRFREKSRLAWAKRLQHVP